MAFGQILQFARDLISGLLEETDVPVINLFRYDLGRAFFLCLFLVMFNQLGAKTLPTVLLVDPDLPNPTDVDVVYPCHNRGDDFAVLVDQLSIDFDVPMLRFENRGVVAVVELVADIFGIVFRPVQNFILDRLARPYGSFLV